MDIDKIKKELSQNEIKVLLALKKVNHEANPDEILNNSDLNHEVEVMNAGSWLQSKKLVEIKNDIKTVFSLGKEGKDFLINGFPEKKALKFIIEKGGQIGLGELSSVLEKSEIPVAIGWLKRKGWVDIKKEKETILIVTDKGKAESQVETFEEKILKRLNEKPGSELDKKEIRDILSRKNVIREKEIVSCTIHLTDKGKGVIDSGLKLSEEISQITSSFIKSGDWKEKAIRPYDIHAFAPSKFGGRPHPLVDLISKIKQMFYEMGFEEIHGNCVETSFWNMDMLFIPQDHPAREMQDTLYCKNPSKFKIKDEKLVNKISEVHKNGGPTSSTGWGYDFSKEEGERVLLRTHTTVNTIRYLYNHPEPPCKVFSVERVFRKENIDSTHLPEFYQIEGIIYEKDANFKQLKGILKEFYARMGFEKIRFRPGYFPYTEPSMEVDVYWNDKWMELGGSGIFRPEVTEPLGIKHPVLAWGLGLERLAMMRFGLKDIRDLYYSDISWLQKTPLL